MGHRGDESERYCCHVCTRVHGGSADALYRILDDATRSLAYYYHYTHPGVKPAQGKWTPAQHDLFQKTLQVSEDIVTCSCHARAGCSYIYTAAYAIARFGPTSPQELGPPKPKQWGLFARHMKEAGRSGKQVRAES